MKYEMKPVWKEPKEEIWDRNFAQLTDTEVSEKSGVSGRMFRWAIVSVAASLVLCLGLAAFAYLYTINLSNQAGRSQLTMLPDGSQVELNAATELSYKPYWWKVERKLKLKGEAFFRVKHGSTFTVLTVTGSVQVLGTTFNVCDREGWFQVSCYTGKVKVNSAGTQAILRPGMQLSKVNQQVKVLRLKVSQDVPDWKMQKFSFDQIPLRIVLEEIQRRYAVRIEAPADLPYLYSGSFAMPDDAQQAVDIIAQTYGIPLRVLK